MLMIILAPNKYTYGLMIKAAMLELIFSDSVKSFVLEVSKPIVKPLRIEVSSKKDRTCVPIVKYLSSTYRP